MKKNILALITLLCLSSPLHAEDIPCRVIDAPCYLKDVSVLRKYPFGSSEIAAQLNQLLPKSFNKLVYSAYSGDQKLYFYMDHSIDSEKKWWGYYIPVTLSDKYGTQIEKRKDGAKGGWVSSDQLDKEIALLREKPSENAPIVKKVSRLSYWQNVPLFNQKHYFYLRRTYYQEKKIWGYFDAGYPNIDDSLLALPKIVEGWAPLDNAFHDLDPNRTEIYIQGKNKDESVKRLWYKPNTMVYSIQKKDSVHNFTYNWQMQNLDWDQVLYKNGIREEKDKK